HPDPDARFESVAAWLEALTAAAEPGTDLSRFTRDGVIPPAKPAPVRRAVEDVGDAAVPLALFPAEDEGPGPAPASARGGDQQEDETVFVPAAGEPAGEEPRQPTGEWLVAAMPEDTPPLADTGPLPIQSLDVEDEDLPGDSAAPASPSRRAPERPAADSGDTPAVAAGAGWGDADPLDTDPDISLRGAAADEGPDEGLDAFAASGAEPSIDWQAPTDEGGSRWARLGAADSGGGGRTWLVAGAALLLFALVALGTWRSLSSGDTGTPITPSADGRAAGEAAGPGDSGDGPRPAAGPDEIAEAPLRPSADDLAPGARPPDDSAATVGAAGGAGAGAAGDARAADRQPAPKGGASAPATDPTAGRGGAAGSAAAPAAASAAAGNAA